MSLRIGLAYFMFACILATPLSAQEDKGKITPKAAELILRNHLRLNSAALVPVKERTTEAIWKQLKAQVFQIDGADFPNRTTIVIKDGKPTVIGHDFGGDGVTSLCIADLKGNGKPYLVYSFSWGSGIHRTQVGALDLFAKEPREIVAAQSLVLDFKHDWKVRALDNKTVRVEGGGVSFGNLELTEGNGKLSLSLRLPNDLPEKVRRNVKTSTTTP